MQITKNINAEKIKGNLSINSVSGTTISGSTIYSGSTDIGTLITNVSSGLSNYLSISGGTGGPYNLTGSTTASTMYASTLIEPTTDNSVDAGTTFKRFRSLNSVNGIAVNFTASTRITTPEIILGTTTITENDVILSGYTLEGGSW
jgi:hemolysin activation/secretion protein